MSTERRLYSGISLVTSLLSKILCIVIADYNINIQYGREGEVVADGHRCSRATLLALRFEPILYTYSNHWTRSVSLYLYTISHRYQTLFERTARYICLPFLKSLKSLAFGMLSVTKFDGSDFLICRTFLHPFLHPLLTDLSSINNSLFFMCIIDRFTIA